MPRVSTYLNFPGTTEQAFTFYRSVFGGEFTGPIHRFADVPADPGQPPIPEADENLVMHIELPILAGHVLMGTDAPESMGSLSRTATACTSISSRTRRPRPRSCSTPWRSTRSSRCPSRTCSGEPISAASPTSSASAGCSTAPARPDRNRQRQDDGLLGSEHRQEVDGLEDEVDVLAAEPGQLVGATETAALRLRKDPRPAQFTLAAACSRRARAIPPAIGYRAKTRDTGDR